MRYATDGRQTTGVGGRRRRALFRHALNRAFILVNMPCYSCIIVDFIPSGRDHAACVRHQTTEQKLPEPDHYYLQTLTYYHTTPTLLEQIVLVFPYYLYLDNSSNYAS